MIAAKWTDMLVGVDIHWVMVPTPGGPVPTPLPHPFSGIIFDPADVVVNSAISGAMAAMGGVFKGPVLINNMHAAATGMEGTNKPVMPHVPTPPGTSWAPVPAGLKPPIPGKPPDPGTPTPVPSNDAILVTGSKTVHINGTNACRLGDLAMSCGEPVRLPSSSVVAVPMGPPVMIGGPPALDYMAAAMGTIRTQWVSGRLGAMADKLLPEKWADRAKKAICFFTGHPVDVASGKVMTDATDLELPGPIPFSFERTYYSGSDYEGPLGHKWAHSYDQFIRIEEEQLVLHDGEGREVYFDHVEEGETTRNPADQLDLTRLKNGFRVDTADDRRLFFGPQGRSDGTLPLLRIEDRNGNRIQLNYDDRGHLTQIIDSAGRELRFRSDSNGRLIALNVPHPEQVGERVDMVRFEYDAEGDLVAVYDAFDHPLEYKYKNHLLVRETDRLDISFYFAYDGIDKDARCVRTWGDDGIYDRILTYDEENQLTVVTDSRGAETLYYWNDLGVVEREVDPFGEETVYEWDEHCNKLSETDPLGNTTEYEYDEMGRLVAETNAEGNALEVKYDGEENIVELTDELDHTWKRSFDERGNVTAVTDPEGETIRYKPNHRGLPTKIVDSKGEELSLKWDGAGNLQRVVDRTGAETQLEHDRLGRLIRRIDAEGGVTELHRDVLGRITAVDDAEDRRSTFRYDAAGNLTAATDSLGRTREFGYGAYGPGGVLDKVTEPSGATTQYDYDNEGDLVAVQDATGRTWNFDRDEAGLVIEERDFTGRRLTYSYDEGGRLIEKTNGRGETTQMERDAMGRLTERTYDDGQTETFAYDPAGRLIEAVNDSAAVEFEYDALGRVIKEVQNGDVVEHQYDASGNRTGRVSPEGRKLSFDYDEEGRLQEVQDPAGPLMRMQRDGLGREIRRSLPSGVETEREYSRTGELVSQRTTRPDEDTPLLERPYTYDQAGDLQQITDSRFGAKEFRYDMDGHLEQVTHPEGTVERYLYDEAGNVPGAPVRLGSAGGDGRGGAEPEWSPAIGEENSSAEGRTIAATQVVEGWTLSYDPDGNLIRKHNEETEYRFYYNAAGRMEWAEQDGKEVARYAYDALNRRIEKDTPEKTVTYRWDGDQLLSEQVDWRKTAGGEPGESTEREYVFSGFQPLAALSEDSDQFFVTDQVGTPRLAVNQDGELVWEADFTGFGETREEYGTGEVEIRYPGQIYDDETGLAYNRFRYYDASLRLYTQADPVGFYGGVLTHNYLQDPQGGLDPLGLFDEWEIARYGASGHVNDGFDAHELLQSGWLKKNVSEYEHRSKGIGRDNPAMALDPEFHEEVTLAQREKGLLDPENLKNQSWRKNIEINEDILKDKMITVRGMDPEVAEAKVRRLKERSERYAKDIGCK